MVCCVSFQMLFFYEYNLLNNQSDLLVTPTVTTVLKLINQAVSRCGDGQASYLLINHSNGIVRSGRSEVRGHHSSLRMIRADIM